MAETTALPKFEVLKGVAVNGSIITVETQLPDRGLGYSMEDLRKWFKQNLHLWLLEHAEEVRGKTVRFSGPNTLPAALYGGIAVAKLGAERVQISTPNPNEWLTVAAHDDREAPVPVVYEPGHVVRARVFGREVSNLVIRSYSLGDQFQLCGMENREQVWVAKRDILRFERRLSRYEERNFSEIPKYRKPFDDLGLKNGQRVRFTLFGCESTGRISALRPASCNIVAESGEGTEQVAVLVPLENIKDKI